MLAAGLQVYTAVSLIYRRRADEILDLCEVALRGWLVGILFNERDCNTEWDWFSALGHTVAYWHRRLWQEYTFILTLAQLN